MSVSRSSTDTDAGDSPPGPVEAEALRRTRAFDEVEAYGAQFAYDRRAYTVWAIMDVTRNLHILAVENIPFYTLIAGNFFLARTNGIFGHKNRFSRLRRLIHTSWGCKMTAAGAKIPFPAFRFFDFALFWRQNDQSLFCSCAI